MGLPLDRVPDWNNDPELVGAGAFWRAIEDWFEALGLQFLIQSKNTVYEGLYLVAGRSPRNPDINHMVVYRNGRLAHDPHPSGLGIDGDPIFVWVVIPLDPAKILTSMPLSSETSNQKGADLA